MLCFRVFCVLGVLFVMKALLVDGGEVYVSWESQSTVNCGDSNNPCATIQSGIEIGCASSPGNVTVLVEPGNYTESQIKISCSLSLQ